MDYSMLIALLAYIAAVQLATKYSVGVFASSVIAVILPSIIDMFTQWIYLSGIDLPILENLFTLTTTVTLVFQFIVAFIVFRNLERTEGYTTWLLWVAGGGVAIIFIIPVIIGRIIT